MTIKEKAKQLLGGHVDAVLGYRDVDGACVPFLFHAGDVEEMCDTCAPDQRYPLAAQARKLLAEDPGLRLAVVARGCDERALVELSKQGQLDRGRLETLGLACTRELASECGCGEPYPGEVVEGEKVEGALDTAMGDKLDAMSPEERLAWWLGRLASCIKCHGCRNVCPMCYCKECALDDPELISRGELPPGEPAFHLIRAVDMAGRCVDCGLCEEACPMGIPLRTLYRKVGEAVRESFGYTPGADDDEKSPLAVLGTEGDVS